jgi:hypothetical protein
MRKSAPDGGHGEPIPSRELPSAPQPCRDPPDSGASLRPVLTRLAVPMSGASAARGER